MKPVFPSRVMGSPFKVDYTDLKQVIAYAKRMGPGNLVYKDPSRNNYNITHNTRWKEIGDPAWVVFES